MIMSFPGNRAFNRVSVIFRSILNILLKNLIIKFPHHKQSPILRQNWELYDIRILLLDIPSLESLFHQFFIYHHILWFGRQSPALTVLLEKTILDHSYKILNIPTLCLTNQDEKKSKKKSAKRKVNSAFDTLFFRVLGFLYYWIE